MLNMLAETINSTFEDKCGKHQLKKETQNVFKVSFSLTIDHAKEDGYRHLEVIFWGPMNYVQVWVRETWDVVPVEDLDEEDGLKPGSKGYQSGATEFKKVTDHDSGWRDGIKRIIEENQKRIMGFGGQSGFWSLQPATSYAFTKA